MALELTKLPKTQFSGLEYTNIIQDITNLVQENPRFNENWDDFLSSNAGRMLIELYSYIADQLSTRIDWFVNEAYIGTATQKKSVMRILKLIGYNFRLPISAEVNIAISFDRPVGNFTLNPSFNANNGTLNLFTLIAKDKNGDTRNFEAINYDEINKKFIFETAITLNTGTSSLPNLNHNIYFYEGRSLINTFFIETSNNQIITLPSSPVIENSVRVFLIKRSGGITTQEELNRVQSFLDPEAQKATDNFGNINPLPYILNVLENDTVTIEFGPTSLLSDETRRPRIDDEIRIFYRIGGGIDGNITKKSINITKRLISNSESVNVTFINNFEGVNGQDGETPEYAAVYAPLQIRTAQKAVTEEDYNTLLLSDNTIIKAKSYGNNNMPSNLYSLYGEYIKPLEVWNFVLKDKPGWENTAPSDYNDFQWITLRLENRFNEKHAFREGEFGELYSLSEGQIISNDLSLNYDGINTEIFRNYVEIITTETFKNNFLNNDKFLAKLTSKIPEEEYFSSLNDNNFFNEIYSTNNGLIDNSNYQIMENIQAYYLSHIDLSGNIDLSTKKFISLSFDNRTTIQDIDLTSEITEIVFTNDIGSSNANYQSQYISFYDNTDQYYIWFNVAAGGVDPTPGGTGYEIALTTSNTSSEITALVLSELNSIGSLKATLYDNSETIRIISISSLDPSAITNATTEATVITIDILAEASDIGTPHEIKERINTEFSFYGDYNNTEAMIQQGIQTFGLSITGTDIVGLTLNTDYYFKINGVEYSFNSGNTLNEPDFDGMVSLMKEAISFTVNGTFTNGDTKITEINKGDFITKIKKGMQITGFSIPVDTIITDVNILEEWITISNPVSSTDNQQELTIYPFEIEIDTGDIKITNLKENPIEYIRIENGQYSIANQNLFTKLVSEGHLINDYPNTFTVSDGVFGKTYLGINGVINATSGYQTFIDNFSDPDATDDYVFTLVVDGENLNGGADITINVADDETAATLAGKIDTALSGLTTTSGYTASCAIDNNGKVRITSDSTGATSTIEIVEGALGNQLWSLFSLVDLDTATDDPIDGEDDAISSLTTATDYQFIINNFTYTVTTTGTTFLSLVSDLDTLLDTHGYSVSVEGSEWNEDILITSDTTSPVCIKDINLFNQFIDIIKIESELKTTENIWTDFGNVYGGGDYSYVAKILEERTDIGTQQYLFLESPSIGMLNSQIKFTGGTATSSERSLFQIFGFDVDPTASFPNDRKICYGYKRLTLISNEEINQFGNYLFEIGTLNFIQGSLPTYNNYLYSEKNQIEIGTFYTDNYEETDPAYRDYGKRIYNTVYNNRNEVDIENSEFFIKLTKEETKDMSIFAIDNDWSITESSPASITSLINPETLVDASNYELNISIDGKGFVEFDITGDNGVSAFYTIDQLINNINSAITSDVNYIEYPYNSYSYAKKDEAGTSIIIQSPTNTNISSIQFDEAVGGVNALTALFGLSEESELLPHTFSVSGDYYISYDQTAIQGDFTLNNEFIENISEADFVKIEVGMKILRIDALINECYVIAKDEDNLKIRMSTSASNSINNQNFYVSKDIMILNKINSGSNLPDLSFYLHFVYDKRYIEGVFDGSEENDVITEGYPLGTLDEDIYDEDLSNAKIVGLNHVFKETKFSTFDIKGTVYYNRIYSAADIEERVIEKLEEEFSLKNRDYAEPIARSKVMSIIHEVVGVEYVEIEYLGKDATDETTNVINTIDATFDEILILSEDRFLAGNKIHGILFNYSLSGT